jgi:hypothetical protein
MLSSELWCGVFQCSGLASREFVSGVTAPGVVRWLCACVCVCVGVVSCIG